MSVNFYGMNCAGPSGFAMFGRQDTSERFLRRACLGRLQPRRLLLRRGGLGWGGFFLGHIWVFDLAVVFAPGVWGSAANTLDPQFCFCPPSGGVCGGVVLVGVFFA